MSGNLLTRARQVYRLHDGGTFFQLTRVVTQQPEWIMQNRLVGIEKVGAFYQTCLIPLPAGTHHVLGGLRRCGGMRFASLAPTMGRFRPPADDPRRSDHGLSARTVGVFARVVPGVFADLARRGRDSLLAPLTGF